MAIEPKERTEYQHIDRQNPRLASMLHGYDDWLTRTLLLIPSENYPSEAVREAKGSRIGNKYAEGYPKRRFYQGAGWVDSVEELAQELARGLFKVPHANVQPHSGSPANWAVLNALLEPGDTFMGMSLTAGGHLTHGAEVSATSKYFNVVQYGANRAGWMDFDQVEDLAKRHHPKLIIAGITAYPRQIDFKKFREIADSVGAILMVDMAHIAGLVAGGSHPSPVEDADVVTTTTHKTLRGNRGALVLPTDRGLQRDPKMAAKIDQSVFPGTQGGLHPDAVAAIAQTLYEALHPNFQTYARNVVENNRILADELLLQGFRLSTGGTDNHVVLVNLLGQEVRGRLFAEGLEAVGLVANKNTVPFDDRSSYSPSGVRAGTPGATSRNMGGPEMRRIGKVFRAVYDGLEKTRARLGFTGDYEQVQNGALRRRVLRETPSLRDIALEVAAFIEPFPILDSYIPDAA